MIFWNSWTSGFKDCADINIEVSKKNKALASNSLVKHKFEFLIELLQLSVWWPINNSNCYCIVVNPQFDK